MEDLEVQVIDDVVPIIDGTKIIMYLTMLACVFACIFLGILIWLS